MGGTVEVQEAKFTNLPGHAFRSFSKLVKREFSSQLSILIVRGHFSPSLNGERVDVSIRRFWVPASVVLLVGFWWRGLREVRSNNPCRIAPTSAKSALHHATGRSLFCPALAIGGTETGGSAPRCRRTASASAAFVGLAWDDSFARRNPPLRSRPKTRPHRPLGGRDVGRPPLRRLLRRASGPQFCGNRGRAVYRLSAGSVCDVVGRSTPPASPLR